MHLAITDLQLQTSAPIKIMQTAKALLPLYPPEEVHGGRWVGEGMVVAIEVKQKTHHEGTK